MKQKFLRTLSLFAFLLVGTFATAQAQAVTSFTADIPFSFTVNNQEFTAGQYQIRLRENGTITHLRLLTADKKKVLTIFSILKETPKYSEYTKLVFRRYGNHYFLGEIWARGQSTGYEILRSETEKQRQQQMRIEPLPVRVTPAYKTESSAVPPSQ